MILVDTSIWVGHLREGDPLLAAHLTAGSVLVHPLVIEELACGRLPRRDEILGLLHALPAAPQASHAELLGFIASAALSGAGLGAVDVHLLASSRLAGARLWSRDAALNRAAFRLGLLPSTA